MGHENAQRKNLEIFSRRKIPLNIHANVFSSTRGARFLVKRLLDGCLFLTMKTFFPDKHPEKNVFARENFISY
jgi:hypothetical protein